MAALLLAVAALGGGDRPPAPPDMSPFAIIRGDLIDGDEVEDSQATQSYKQVGAILRDGSIHCTGTLVSNHTVLTAAHCVEPNSKQIRNGQLSFAIGPDSARPQHSYRIVDGAFPQESGLKYDPGDRTHDIGLLYLADSPALAPIPLHPGVPSWADLQTTAITFVGFGLDRLKDGRLGGAGIKRAGRWPVTLSGKYRLGWAGTGQTACSFDSGGPGFDIRGAAPLLVAVISEGDAACTGGHSTRVDAYRQWISARFR